MKVEGSRVKICHPNSIHENTQHLNFVLNYVDLYHYREAVNPWDFFLKYDHVHIGKRKFEHNWIRNHPC